MTKVAFGWMHKIKSIWGGKKESLFVKESSPPLHGEGGLLSEVLICDLDYTEASQQEATRAP